MQWSNAKVNPGSTMMWETDKVCNYLNNTNPYIMVNFIQIMFLIICIYFYLFILSFIQ